MSATTDVWNVAVSYIGEDHRIESETSDGVIARRVRTMWPGVLADVSEAFDWSFTRHYSEAVAVSNVAPPPGWDHVWQYPAETSKVHSVHINNHTANGHLYGYDVVYGDPEPKSPKIEFTVFTHTVEGNYSTRLIATRGKIDQIRHSVYIKDLTRWTPTARDALAWRLAYAIAMPASRDPNLQARYYEMYLRTVQQAAALDAGQIHQERETNTFIQARG